MCVCIYTGTQSKTAGVSCLASLQGMQACDCVAARMCAGRDWHVCIFELTICTKFVGLIYSHHLFQSIYRCKIGLIICSLNTYMSSETLII